MKFFIFAALSFFLVWVIFSLMMLWGVVFQIGFWKMSTTLGLLSLASIAIYVAFEQIRESKELKQKRFLD
ncbi:MAG: hypothetical protein Q4B71_07115 [Cardiobacteriaceae bacterium]|nr:hypothetical protein [Cardiobacteriaceae bacterium]